MGPIAFLPLSAATLFSRHPSSAALLLFLFLGCGGLAFLFWHRRSRLSVLRALLIVLAVQFVAIMVGTVVLYRNEVREPLSGTLVSPSLFVILPVAYACIFWRLRSLGRQGSSVA